MHVHVYRDLLNSGILFVSYNAESCTDNHVKYVHVHVCMYVHLRAYIHVHVRMYQCPSQKKNSGVLPDSKQIYEKNLINVHMYVMNDYATHTYTICNLKQ